MILAVKALFYTLHVAGDYQRKNIFNALLGKTWEFLFTVSQGIASRQVLSATRSIILEPNIQTITHFHMMVMSS